MRMIHIRLLDPFGVVVEEGTYVPEEASKRAAEFVTYQATDDYEGSEGLPGSIEFKPVEQAA